MTIAGGVLVLIAGRLWLADDEWEEMRLDETIDRLTSMTSNMENVTEWTCELEL